MRHLVGVVLALATAAALFFGAGWGVARVLAARAHDTSMIGLSGGLVTAALLGAGLFVGVLVTVPTLSPLGAGLPGLILFGWSALELVSAHRALRLIPLTGLDAASGFRTMLTGGVLTMLGAVMIVPLFIPSRWRRREAADEFAALARAELVH